MRQRSNAKLAMWKHYCSWWCNTSCLQKHWLCLFLNLKVIIVPPAFKLFRTDLFQCFRILFYWLWILSWLNIHRVSKILCIFIAHQHTDARYWYSKSLCSSVRLSVCSVCYISVPYENGLTYRHSFFTQTF